uniref:tumor necrosis factor ligand superfamily member 13B isoform X2 n=1 Tax=Myxine glutinosa TaxID=7769 RepID=UPI0035900BEA
MMGGAPAVAGTWSRLAEVVGTRGPRTGFLREHWSLLFGVLALVVAIFALVLVFLLGLEFSKLQEHQDREVQNKWMKDDAQGVNGAHQESLVQRMRRATLSHNKRRTSFIHLHVKRKRTEGRLTYFDWEKAEGRGPALSLSSDLNSVKIEKTGFYYLYGQVLFIDKYFTMGYIIHAVSDDHNEPMPLLRCVENMPNRSNIFSTCHTSGIVRLQANEKIVLEVPRRDAEINIDHDSTFFGVIKIN